MGSADKIAWTWHALCRYKKRHVELREEHREHRTGRPMHGLAAAGSLMSLTVIDHWSTHLLLGEYCLNGLTSAR